MSFLVAVVSKTKPSVARTIGSLLCELAPGTFVSVSIGKRSRELLIQALRNEIDETGGSAMLAWQDPAAPSGLVILQIGDLLMHHVEVDGIWLSAKKKRNRKHLEYPLVAS